MIKGIRARPSRLPVAAALLGAALTCNVPAAEPGALAAHKEGSGPQGAHQEAAPTAARTSGFYALPPIQLVRDDGKNVSLNDELNDGRPVVLNFIYTTCTGICPLASHIFSQLQHKLGTQSEQVHLMSISIDPEEDTPSRLREYAHRYAAGPSWQHYTGSIAATTTAQRAFGVYKGDKMGHTPVTLLRTAPGAPWVRFDGFATADVLLQELHAQSPSAPALSSRAP